MATSASTPCAIRFVGHYDLAAEGKFLWEILCQLRNLGTGRYVTKNEWARKWPKEASYMRIVRARPEMDRWMWRGRVWAEWIFRGRNLGIYEFANDLNRSDWKLIHKHEEADYLNNKMQMPILEVPNSFPLPPLHTYLAKKFAARTKKEWSTARERAPLQLVIDPQHENLRQFIRQVEPKQKGLSIYDEVDPQAYLDWYGNLLPGKVEAWNTGPAYGTFHFMPPPEPEEL